MKFLDALALEIKLISGGSAATAARFAQARGAVDAMPKRRQVGGLSRRLKRAETYLNRRGKRGATRMGGKAKRGPYIPLKGRAMGGGMIRPRSLAEMRIFVDEAAVRAGHAAAGVGRARDIPRHMRFHQLAVGRLQQWEASKRPPKGFRRGK